MKLMRVLLILTAVLLVATAKPPAWLRTTATSIYTIHAYSPWIDWLITLSLTRTDPQHTPVPHKICPPPE